MHYSHMAEHVRSKGRGDDTMLVHMTPHEVGGLQALAMAHGGSLTINPDTGLPEAGWLGKLLPTILGAVGMAFGIPPIWMGALGAVGGTAITGNLKEGLMAGLGAFGGASMAGAAGLAGGISKNALGLMGSAGSGMPSITAGFANMPLGEIAAKHAAQAAGSGITLGGSGSALVAGSGVGSTIPGVVGTTVAPGAVSAIPGGGIIASGAGTAAGTAAKTGLGGVLQNFGNSAKMGLPAGILQKAAVPLAAMGVMNSVSGALTPTPKKDETPVDEYGYTGPYTAHREEFTPAGMNNSKPFDPTNFSSVPQRYFGGTTYTDAAGKAWIPGQKTTPTAANATSAMANPVQLTSPQAPLGLPQPQQNNPNLTPEQYAMLMQQYGNQGAATFADGGQVQNAPYSFPIQSVPQPAQQTIDGSYSMQQPQPQQSPYMQQSGYGQPQQSNNPNTANSNGIKGLPGLAAGGTLHMRSGSFIMPARETAEFGNGSSGAGQQVLARLGGTPIHGGGDGVSDSVSARIDGNQKARVARDEVHFSPEAVARVGGGNHKKGTQKLYALMDKAQKARKSAKRGQDTGLRAVA